jgi:hypothetical protein
MQKADPGDKDMVSTRPKLFNFFFHLPLIFYALLSITLASAVVGKIAVTHSFETNEGANAFWASVAMNGSTLYPPPDSFKLDIYPPLWFYATGTLGRLIGDNVQAGRIFAAATLLLDAVAIALIIRNVTGRGPSAWFGGAAFLAIFALFYGTYYGMNDGQTAANLAMTISILWFIRRMPDRLDGSVAWIVPLMIIGGLIKPNVLAAPVSVAIFLLYYRRSAFLAFASESLLGVTVVCAAFSFIYGSGFLSSLLLERPYDLAVGWSQTKDQFWKYNVLLLVPFLALRSSPKEAFVFIYAAVSALQGFLLGGGDGVDVNVFFDFAAAISIGLGLLHSRVVESINSSFGAYRELVAVGAWLLLTTVPLAASLSFGAQQARRVLSAITTDSQADDIAYIRSTPGPVICDDLALCYWAGKDFEVDLTSLTIMIWARPYVEREFLAKIEACSYSLIQLDHDWEHDLGTLTEKIILALQDHYVEVRKIGDEVYLVPLHCSK